MILYRLILALCIFSQYGCATAKLWRLDSTDVIETTNYVQPSVIYYNENKSALCIPYRHSEGRFAERGSLLISPIQKESLKKLQAYIVEHPYQTDKFVGEYKLEVKFVGSDGILHVPNVKQVEMFKLSTAAQVEDETGQPIRNRDRADIKIQVINDKIESKGRMKQPNTTCSSEEWNMLFDNKNPVDLAIVEQDVEYKFHNSTTTRTILTPFSAAFDIVTVPITFVVILFVAIFI